MCEPPAFAGFGAQESSLLLGMSHSLRQYLQEAGGCKNIDHEKIRAKYETGARPAVLLHVARIAEMYMGFLRRIRLPKSRRLEKQNLCLSIYCGIIKHMKQLTGYVMRDLLLFAKLWNKKKIFPFRCLTLSAG